MEGKMDDQDSEAEMVSQMGERERERVKAEKMRHLSLTLLVSRPRD